MVVDAREAEVGEGQAREASDGLVRLQEAAAQLLDKLMQIVTVHEPQYPASMPASPEPTHRIAYLGPQGTFTEEALLAEADLAAAVLLPMTSIAEAIGAADQREVEFAFVPIENSIEGSVSADA